MSVAGVIIGAFLLFRLNSRLEERKTRMAARYTAYADFLTALLDARAGVSFGDGARLKEALVRAGGARLRVGLHGSAEVIEAIVHYNRMPEGADANAFFLDVYEAMRADGLDASTPRARLSALVLEGPIATGGTYTLNAAAKAERQETT